MAEFNKVGGNGKSLFPAWLLGPLIIFVYGSILLVVILPFILVLIIGTIGFVFWGIFNPRQILAKFREIWLFVADFWGQH